MRYSKGGFAHLVRTETGTPFYTFTELLKAQASPRNRCVKVIADGTLDCSQTSATPLGQGTTLIFETDELTLRSGEIPSKLQMTGLDVQLGRLIAIPEAANLNVEISGQPTKKLIGNEVMWLPAGASTTLVNLGSPGTEYFLITFKDSAEKK